MLSLAIQSLKIKNFYLICMGVFVCVLCACLVLTEVRDGIGASGTRVSLHMGAGNEPISSGKATSAFFFKKKKAHFKKQSNQCFLKCAFVYLLVHVPHIYYTSRSHIEEGIFGTGIHRQLLTAQCRGWGLNPDLL